MQNLSIEKDDIVNFNTKVIMQFCADTTKNKRITNDFCEIFDCDIKDIKKIKEEASKKYTKLIYSDFLKRNLNNLKKYLKLSQLECDVFAFFYYCDNNFSYRVSYNTILAQKIISKIFNYPLKSIAKSRFYFI